MSWNRVKSHEYIVWYARMRNYLKNDWLPALSCLEGASPLLPLIHTMVTANRISFQWRDYWQVSLIMTYRITMYATIFSQTRIRAGWGVHKYGGNWVQSSRPWSMGYCYSGAVFSNSPWRWTFCEFLTFWFCCRFAGGRSGKLVEACHMFSLVWLYVEP